MERERAFITMRSLLGGLSPLQGLIFFLFVPLYRTVHSAFLPFAAIEFSAHWIAIAYLLSHAFIFWWLLEVLSRLIGKFLSPMRIPLLPQFVIAVLITIMVNGFLEHLRAIVFDPSLVSGSLVGQDSQIDLSNSLNFYNFLLGISEAFLSWSAVNFILIVFLKVPRFGYSPAEKWQSVFLGIRPTINKDVQSNGTPEAYFLSQLPSSLGTEFISLEAQQHYVLVTTVTGSKLVHSTFHGALAAVSDLDGLRVHRSFWVNKAAIKTVLRDGREFKIELYTGAIIPVSRSYRVKVEELGRETQDLKSLH